MLTRGYGAKPPACPHPVRLDDPVSACGDEPLDLMSRLADVQIIIDPDRKRAAEWAQSRINPDLFILDDGFQHMRMPRHVDIVLLSAYDLGKGWNRVIPSGEWREGQNALRRADLFAVHLNSDPDRTRAAAAKRLHGFGKPIVYFQTKANRLRKVADNSRVTGLNSPYLALAGISNPGRFIHSAQTFLQKPAGGTLFFPDHHIFTPRDWEKINRTARDKGCKHILCTSKDAVKLKNMADDKLLCLDIGIQLSDTDQARLWKILDSGRNRLELR